MASANPIERPLDRHVAGARLRHRRDERLEPCAVARQHHPFGARLCPRRDAGLAVQLFVGDELLEDTNALSSAIQDALEEYAHD